MVLSITDFCLHVRVQKLGAPGTKKKGARENMTSNLAAAARGLLQGLQRGGIIGEFELDFACLSGLANLAPHQQTQVRRSFIPLIHMVHYICTLSMY